MQSKISIAPEQRREPNREQFHLWESLLPRRAIWGHTSIRDW